MHSPSVSQVGIQGDGVSVRGNININQSFVENNCELPDAKPIGNVDVQPCPTNFIVRSVELHQIQDIFSNHGIVIIQGMAGAGKTSLAQRFVADNVQDFQNFIWVESETSGLLLSKFKRLAEKTGVDWIKEEEKSQMEQRIPQIVNDIYTKMSQHPTIIIFDNAEAWENASEILQGIKTFMPPLLPPDMLPKILVTTRYLGMWDQVGQNKIISIDKFSASDAKNFIIKQLEDTMDDANTTWEILANYFEYLPIALDSATALIRRNQKLGNFNPRAKPYLIQNFMDEMESQTLPELVTKDAGNLVHTKLRKLWEMNFRRLQEPTCLEGNAALGILDLLAFMPPDGIDLKLFRDILNPESESAENECTHALDLLSSLSLVSHSSDNKIKMHRLLQQTLVEKLKSSPKLSFLPQTLPEVRRVLIMKNPSLGIVAWHEIAESFGRTFTHFLGIKTFVVELQDIFHELRDISNETAVKLYTAMHQNLIQQYGEDDIRSIALEYTLAEKLRSEPASKMLLKEYERRRSKFSEEYYLTALTRSWYIWTFRRSGLLAEFLQIHQKHLETVYAGEKAQELFQRELNDEFLFKDWSTWITSTDPTPILEYYNRLKTHYGNDHPYSIVVGVLCAEGLTNVLPPPPEVFSIVSDILEELYDTILKKFGGYCPLFFKLIRCWKGIVPLALSLDLPTRNHENQDSDCEQFLAFAKERLQQQEKSLGIDHGVTNLTRIFVTRGLLKNPQTSKEAQETLQTCYERQCEVLGRDHAITIQTRDEYSTSLLRTGNIQEAFSLLNEECYRHLKLHGADHPLTLNSRNQYTNFLSMIDQLESCENIMMAQFLRQKENLGSTDPRTISSRNKLISILKRSGKYENILDILCSEYDTLIEQHGPDSLKARDILKHLLYICPWNDSNSAELLQRYTIKMGPDHPVICTMRMFLIETNENFVERNELLKETYNRQKKVLGSDDKRTLASRNLYFAKLDRDKVMSAFRNEYERQKREIGPDDLRTIQTRNIVAGEYSWSHKYDEARNLLTSDYHRQLRELGPNDPRTIATGILCLPTQVLSIPYYVNPVLLLEI